MTTVEDRTHRSHKLNPRRWPWGRSYELHKQAVDFYGQLDKIALLSSHEMNFIQDVPRLLGDGLYANLGHAGGGSAILMAACIKELGLKAIVQSVDLFGKDNLIRRAAQTLETFGVTEYVKLCAGSTDDWAIEFQNTAFNFVFIDADHTYEAVKRDFTNWGPLVKPGGWVCFHDTNQDFSHNAIEETVAKVWPELKGYHIDRIRTFQRPL